MSIRTIQDRTGDERIDDDINRIPWRDLGDDDKDRLINETTLDSFDEYGPDLVALLTQGNKVEEMAKFHQDNNGLSSLFSVGDYRHFVTKMHTLYVSDPQRFGNRLDELRNNGHIEFPHGMNPQIVDPSMEIMDYHIDPARGEGGYRYWDDPNWRTSRTDEAVPEWRNRRWFPATRTIRPFGSIETGPQNDIFIGQTYPMGLRGIPAWLYDDYVENSDRPLGVAMNHPFLHKRAIYDNVQNLLGFEGDNAGFQQYLNQKYTDGSLYDSYKPTDWYERNVGGQFRNLGLGTEFTGAGKQAQQGDTFEYLAIAEDLGLSNKAQNHVDKYNVALTKAQELGDDEEAWAEVERLKSIMVDTERDAFPFLHLFLPDAWAEPGGREVRPEDTMTYYTPTELNHAIITAILMEKNDSGLNPVDVRQLSHYGKEASNTPAWIHFADVRDQESWDEPFRINIDPEHAKISGVARERITTALQNPVDHAGPFQIIGWMAHHLSGGSYWSREGRIKEEQKTVDKPALSLLRDDDGNINSVWGLKGELGQKIESLVGLTIGYNLLGLNDVGTIGNSIEPPQVGIFASLTPEEFWNADQMALQLGMVDETYMERWRNLKESFSSIFDNLSRQERKALYFLGIGGEVIDPKGSPVYNSPKHDLFKMFVLNAQNKRIFMPKTPTEGRGWPRPVPTTWAGRPRMDFLEPIDRAIDMSMSGDLVEWRDGLNKVTVPVGDDIEDRRTKNVLPRLQKLVQETGHNWEEWVNDPTFILNPDGSTPKEELFDRTRLQKAWELTKTEYNNNRLYWETLGIISDNSLFNLRLQNSIYKGTSVPIIPTRR